MNSTNPITGSIHGNVIRLDHDAGLPDGQRVSIVLQPFSGAPNPSRLQQAFGAWADDAEDVDQFLTWNRSQRKATRPEVEP